MVNDLIDSMVSLTALMEEESEKLARIGQFPELGEIAAAKMRLAGRMEAQIARLDRETPDWAKDLDSGTRAALADASMALRDASRVNAGVLERQIDLSVELMNAICTEAQRLTGKRNATYGACGGIAPREDSAPISINTRL